MKYNKRKPIETTYLNYVQKDPKTMLMDIKYER